MEAVDVQARHRRRLVAGWPIFAGDRVLEIGCGQGDTTVALAEAVGPAGKVVAIDRASPDYGAPQTLGEAAAVIGASEMGNRVEFRFDFDLLELGAGRLGTDFDVVVFAHSSWYFASDEQLVETLAAARKVGRRLAFAEWDLEPSSLGQIPHLMAVLAQGLAAAFEVECLGNVRTPRSKAQARALIEKAGWAIVSAEAVPADGLQDADWEIAACLGGALPEAMPSRIRGLVEAQKDALRATARPKGNRALDVYSLAAE